MKVNSINKNSISFNGFYDSNALKKILSFAENNGALFASATALTLSATARPLSIMATPKTDKENKKIACAKAVTSTILDFCITLAISAPIVKAVGRINNNPNKYLKKETIENLKGNAKNLKDSKAYTLANQAFKLGIGIAIAAPKAILNLIGMPYILDFLFDNKKPEAIVNNDSTSKNGLNFKKRESDKLASIIGKIIDQKSIQEFSKKNAESNFPMHINAIKDIFTTGVFVTGLSNSNKIEQDRKKPLIYNSITGTLLSIISGYLLDSLTEKPAEKFIEKLKAANQNDPKLKKYTDGFKIAKPAIILGTMYYAIIPMISTFLGERINNIKNKNYKSKTESFSNAEL